MANIYKPNTDKYILGHSTAPLDPKRCKAGVHSSEGLSGYAQCARKAKKDGWCSQHHPDAEEARRKAASEKYKAKLRRHSLGFYGQRFMAALVKIRDGDNDPRETARIALEGCKYAPEEPSQ